jgi:hypothetical protein
LLILPRRKRLGLYDRIEAMQHFRLNEPERFARSLKISFPYLVKCPAFLRAEGKFENDISSLLGIRPGKMRRYH